MTEYPFSSHHLDRDGLRMHYLDEGVGEPIVLVHGNPTWSFYYRNLISSLRSSYRCIAPDHIGCGLSDKPNLARYPYTLASRIEDLEHLLDTLRLDRDVTLVLHDWGGMIGMGVALRRPERIRRLVLLNTAAFLIPPGKRLPLSLKLCRTPLLGPLLVRGFNAFCRGAMRYCTTKPLSREARAGYLAPYDSWPNRVAILRFVQDIPLSPEHPSYQTALKIDQGLASLSHLPTLICWGERDFVFDHHFLAEWQRRWPDAQIQRFPEAGHLVLEDEGPAILEHLRTFLDQHPLQTVPGSPLETEARS